jgi:hypothetical protein
MDGQTTTRGRVMSIQTIDQAIEDQAIQDQLIKPWEASSLQVRDILWTLGMCAVSLSLTPFVAFYVLLVA